MGRESDSTRVENKIFNGFSGGMMLHIGYGFAGNPQALFSNWSIAQETVKGMNKGGVYLGIGGQLRIHLLRHLRVGGEGYVSNMPLHKGSQVRTGWGGAIVDAYTDWGKVRPFVGIGMGGGAMRRTYVGDNLADVSAATDTATVYNASFEKTPFFYLDPQLGMEFRVTNHINVITRIDWVLPFGRNREGIGASMRNWSGYMTPSGPRLYIGMMFGH